MTKSDCGRHRWEWVTSKEFYRPLLIGLLVLCVVVGIIVLVVFLVLRPTKPSFALQDASILDLDLAHPNLLSSTLQVTLFSRNPNEKVGVFYDHLAVHAAYRDQQITMSTPLPPSYQGSKDVTVWSPFLHSASIPVAPYVADSLSQEGFSGILRLKVRIGGKVRWKVGSWRSGSYHIHVECPAVFHYGGARGSDGVFTPAIRFQHMSGCHVDV